MIRTQIECFRNVERGELLRPASMLKMLNRLLLKTLQRGKFVTMFVGVLDTHTHHFCYASAGHCAAYLIKPDDEVITLPPAGMVCGLCGTPFDKMVKEECLTIPEGAFLAVNTDGLTEATNRHGDMYGDDRYKDTVGTLLPGDSNKKAMSKIWDSVMSHLEFGDLSDDCTLVSIHRTR
jgi:sigma-B regulation protein RsbU (phosphoserine phosphatase)